MINGLQLLLLLLAAGGLVFLSAAVRLPWLEPWARLDLLPALMVYAAVKTDLWMVGVTALVGGVANMRNASAITALNTGAATVPP